MDWIYPLLYLTVLTIPSPYALFVPQIFSFVIISLFDNITGFKALTALEPSSTRIIVHEICAIFYLLVTLFQSSKSDSFKWIIYALNGALLMATYGAVIKHEALHMGGKLYKIRSSFVYLMANLIDITLGMSWGFGQYHWKGHHVKFACPEDFDTPYFNESFWEFLPRNWMGNFYYGSRVDSIVIIITFFSCSYLILGWKALAHLLLQSIVTQISFSSNAYTQHYGLNRNLTYKSVDNNKELRSHTWDSPGWLFNSVFMGAGFHHAHHVKYLKKLAKESVPLNSGIGILDSASLALFPQLWFKKINPLIPTEIRLIKKNDFIEMMDVELINEFTVNGRNSIEYANKSQT
ncbi:17945_t:CDS:1 [Dentiscutata erythropus]|uniref:17945_t:CDS:1 n=1 Tax=Dentiscutata erythropus TaxID=1348616 RepID=A0A9N9C195_9GLOM|nr:17945_t:CDS:1 [Dentiscutata erythropus]